MNQEPLPQIHLIRDTDLSVFAYELHIFAGDFLRECEFNMRSLATNTVADSIAIMGKNHMWLSDALWAYSSVSGQSVLPKSHYGYPDWNMKSLLDQM